MYPAIINMSRVHKDLLNKVIGFNMSYGAIKHF